MKPLGIEHYFADGMYAKEMRIPAGHFVKKHLHDFTHLSVLAAGTVILKMNGKAKLMKAPACITVPAGMEHVIDAVTDAVWFCIHATDETDPEKVDQVLIKECA
jgi:quercetin dioxygenase-like cupin family protein